MQSVTVLRSSQAWRKTEEKGWARTFVRRNGPELLLQLLDDARAPVDYGSKDIEYEGLHALEGMCRRRHSA